MKGLVKIEVDKKNGHYFYTGTLEDLGDEYKIYTIKNEVLRFRKDQIVQIEELKRDAKNEMIGDDAGEKQ